VSLIPFAFAVHASSDRPAHQPQYTETSPLVIPAAAFRSDGFLPGSFFFPFSGGYLQGDSENYGCVEAEAPLPSGFVVKRMSVSLYDNDAGRNVSVTLRKVDNFTGTGSVMGQVSTLGTSNSVQVLTDSFIVGSLVSYPDFSYYLTTCLGSGNIRLYSVQLYYAPVDVFDDGFESGDTSAWSNTMP
jgi:hypothetical protein